jgi:hypothetical protein
VSAKVSPATRIGFTAPLKRLIISAGFLYLLRVALIEKIR